MSASQDVNHTDVDAGWVARLAEGDLDALGKLYQRHGGAVRAFLIRIAPALSHEDADDLCQETFLTFAHRIRRYEHQGRLRAWLFGIAVRKARQAGRKRWWRAVLRRREGVGAAGVSLREPRPDDDVAARQRIAQVLEALPVPQREALVLTAVEGLSVKDAAEVLGVSENAVSTRLYRARAALEGADE